MKKKLMMAAIAASAAATAMAETVTFDFTTEDPYGWEALAKDANGYVASAHECDEQPVVLTLDGKYRRLAQNAFGGLTCLLLYQNATADFTIAEGYKISTVTFYTGKGKCGQLEGTNGATLAAEQLTDVEYEHSTNAGTMLSQAIRTGSCANPSSEMSFVVASKGTQVISKIEVDYLMDEDVDPDSFTAAYDFTTFSSEAVKDFPAIKVGQWWTTNPDDEGSYTAGAEFRPLTLTSGDTEITFSYNGKGGHGNVRGTTTSKQNNLQLGSGSCFTIKPLTEDYVLEKVDVQGNRKRTATGLSMLGEVTTDDKGALSFDEAAQLLTWTPTEDNAVCYLDANGGAYIENIRVEYRKAETQTGIEAVAAEGDASVEYFNLQGMRTDNPTGGIYIRRQGGKTEKVYIR